eukprot:6607003-Lingulodinium_polyedra.AAC.1
MKNVDAQPVLPWSRTRVKQGNVASSASRSGPGPARMRSLICSRFLFLLAARFAGAGPAGSGAQGGAAGSAKASRPLPVAPRSWPSMARTKPSAATLKRVVGFSVSSVSLRKACACRFHSATASSSAASLLSPSCTFKSGRTLVGEGSAKESRQSDPGGSRPWVPAPV